MDKLDEVETEKAGSSDEEVSTKHIINSGTLGQGAHGISLIFKLYIVCTVCLIFLYTPLIFLEIRVIIKILKNPCYPIVV